MKRALFLYYSLTHQTGRAVEEMAQALRDEGWETRECRIDLAPECRIEFPIRPFWPTSLRLGLPCLLARPSPVVFDEAVLGEHFDLVCIGSPTWTFSPAIPISSFLQTPEAAKLLSGTPFAVFAVCRGFWKRNVAVVRKLATKAGGRFVAGEGFTFDGSQLQSLGSFLSYHQSGGVEAERWRGIRITPYGLSEATLGRAADFARRLAKVL